MSNYDYLDLATIWKSKAKGTLSLVIALANFDLPKKYAKTNPPMVIFTDGLRIFSSPVDRFLDLRYFVRKDESAYDHLMQIFTSPITEDEEQPLLQDEDEEDDLMLADSDDADEAVAERMNPVEASALTRDEQKLYETSSGKVIEANAVVPARVVVDTAEPDQELKDSLKSFVKYTQTRTIDGTFYHHLEFTSLDPVSKLLDHITDDSLISMSVQFKDMIIPIELEYVTSTYTSAENVFDANGNVVDVKYTYNMVIAQEPETEEEEFITNDLVENESIESVPAIRPVDSAADVSASNASVDDAAQDEPAHDNVLTRAESIDSSSIGSISESTEQNEPESSDLSDDSISNVEEISINADHEEDELENADELDEAYTSTEVEEQSEISNADEIEEDTSAEDAKLLVDSLIMPEDELIEEIPTDEVAESLANKLEAISETSEESTQEDQAEETKTTSELSAEVVDEVLTAIQEEKKEDSEEKKED